MKNEGFTFVELIIIIAVLSILGVVSVVTYSTVLRNYRDQTRRNDLQTIRKSLEMYRSQNRRYPTSSNFRLDIATNLSTNGAVYLDPVPKDPQSPNKKYLYVALPDVIDPPDPCIGAECNDFVLCARAEDNTLPSPTTCGNFNCVSGGTGGQYACNVEVKSSQ